MRESDPSAIGRRVERIWNDVLEVTPEEAGATFFELGGQGVSALRIAARVGAELGIAVEAGAVFEHPSLPAFVRHVLARARDAAEDASEGASGDHSQSGPQGL
ncbi:phosphopantetheine-binding protein [Sphaerisporangium album]|uniref:phosphopantetheine-binding protein n=1 Tax=Sphaerisporangium album TaxID=509200 RepID=UPI001C689DCB|nr:phosphopantetheine-binding protein [Sphaerisporangium album]